MKNINISIIIFGSVVSLLGTMIGASIGVFVKKPDNKFLGAVIGFAGGVMLSIVVFDLLPQALKNWSYFYTLLFCMIGIVLISSIERFINIRNLKGSMKVAITAALALMIHNFPEGIIMGCGFAGGSILGLKMSLAIAIHDIPEGIAVSAPLMASKVKTSKILLYAFFTALPTAIGAFIGVKIGSISQNVLGISLSTASGIMLYVVVCEMFPESYRQWSGTLSTIGSLIGILLGLMMSLL